MSQTRRILKEIASTGEYEALVAAVEQADYEAMFGNYVRISERLSRGKRVIEESIENLPLQNKEERRDKFFRAFELATQRILPVWHQLHQQLHSGLAERKIMEGEVFGFGRKGDPLVKTPEGVIVVLNGLKAEEGERVRFRVVQETETLSFGRVFELNPQFFYLLMTQEARQKIEDSLAVIGDRLETSPEPLNEVSLSELGELLHKLEDIGKLSSPFRAGERERIAAQVLRYRKGLLYGAGIRIMFEFISRQEEKDIDNFYQDGYEEKATALLAVGLFRRHTYEAAKGLLLSDKPEGYEQVMSEMEDKIDSMDSAMKLLEFRSAVDDVYPRAKRYLGKMGGLFDRLAERAKRVTEALSQKGVADPEEIELAIKKAFSEETLFVELRKAFGSSKEFLSLRGALAELNRKLGNQESTSAEAAFRPYLRHKILQAFGPEA